MKPFRIRLLRAMGPLLLLTFVLFQTGCSRFYPL